VVLSVAFPRKEIGIKKPDAQYAGLEKV